MLNKLNYLNFKKVKPMELSEKIREKINSMIDDALNETGKDAPEPVKHLLTQICYEMYKKGLDDGHRFCIKSIELSRENINR